MKKVQAHYDAVAHIYDRRYGVGKGSQYYAHLTRQMLECLDTKGLLLDIGCGTGLFIERYLTQGSEAIGIDLSRGMIAHARERLPESDFLVGTAEALPFRENTFDSVASLLTFSYIQHPEAMIADVHRILRPGGTFALCTLGKNLLTSVIPALYWIGEKMEVRKIGVGDFDERYYDEDEMEVLLENAGFTEVCVRRCSFAHVSLASPIFHIARKMEPFVEEKLPYFAYNLCASGKKPG
ncbi:MAG: class I SAM-dependent methyltransferase [Methanomicrobiales archaeon]|nr:class I SAM-dependent methyltransferase [Methanomicrobiales archaeon]